MKNRNVLADMKEHLDGIHDVAPALNYLACTGDSHLKADYLHKKLTDEDYEAWGDGFVSDHCRELLKDIDADVTNVRIEYDLESKQYAIEVAERIEVYISDFSVEFEID